MADITKDQVIEWLSGLTVVDAAALVKELEEKWGVSAAAPRERGLLLPWLLWLAELLLQQKKRIRST